jgi:hypothetical protein
MVAAALFELGEPSTSHSSRPLGALTAPHHLAPHADLHHLRHAPAPAEPRAVLPRPARGAGARLARRLHAVEAPADLREAAHLPPPAWPAGAPGAALLAGLRAIPAALGAALQPQGATDNDDTWPQRCLNVATSLPFVAVGARMVGAHRSAEGKLYGASIAAVGVSASLYHASSGAARPLARKLDYWTIAASSAALLRALWPDSGGARAAARAGLAAVPFRPFLVSTANSAAMQVEFVRQAAAHPEVRPAARRHLACALGGLAVFAVEDALIDHPLGQYAHAAWHLLALAGTATTSDLVQHKEAQRLGPRGGSPPARRRPPLGGFGGGPHDSARSLAAMGGESPPPGFCK